MASRAEKLLAKGQTLEKKGKQAQALEHYRDACKTEPYDPDLWMARATVAEALGDRGEAAESLFRVCDLFVRGGIPAEALKIVKRVLEIEPGHGGARRFLRMLEARFDEAEEEASIAAKSEAGTPETKPAPASVADTIHALEEVTAAPDDDDFEPEIEIAAGTPLPEEPEPEPEPRSAISSRGVIFDEPEEPTITMVADEPPERDEAEPDPPAPIAAAAAPAPVEPPAAEPQGGIVSEFTLGSLTGELALDSLSLRERLSFKDRHDKDDATKAADIPLDDDARFDVVQAVASTLSSSPLLSELDSDLVKMLIDCGALVHRAAGDAVFKQGDIGSSLYLILAGEVAILRDEPTAPAQELARLRPGAFFGEMALLTNTRRSASVKALKNVDLLEVSRRAVLQMVDRDPRVLKLLMRFFRARLVGTLLQTSPLFTPFSREARKGLIARFKLRELPADHVVIRDGDSADGLFIVLVGRLEAEKDGKVLGALAAGDVFGEMSLLDRGPAVATVRTRVRSWVLLLGRADFDELCSAHPHIRAQLALVADRRRADNRALLAKPVREERVDPV